MFFTLRICVYKKAYFDDQYNNNPKKRRQV